MGRAGRAHVERCYDRAALAREYRKILELPRVGPGPRKQGHPGRAGAGL